ncbi:MAG: hypothetical protein NUV31_06520 [Dehalococcoidales bacterium]|jgi:hypothetical protein|nr:hypothetical protein [Dehalococcoidales bacterium]
MEENVPESRWESRDRKLRKRREKMQKHGASLARIYRDAIEKRARSSSRKSGKGFRLK